MKRLLCFIFGHDFIRPGLCLSENAERVHCTFCERDFALYVGPGELHGHIAPWTKARELYERAPFAGYRTANSALAEMPGELALDCVATANALPEQLADGWHVLAPFGEFPEPGGRYVQVFGAPQADAMIRSWNSIAGRSFRWLKNARHRLKPSLSMPIFDAPPGAAHPDLDPSDWSKLPIVGEVTELRATANAIEGKVLWSDAARRGDRERGPLHPSINWWHDRPDAAGRVYPEHVESVTLTRTPNIRTVPAWTANTTGHPPDPLAGNPQAENQDQTANTHPMNKEQLEALRRALGLTEAADPHACIQAAMTANAAVATLTTANATIATLNSERDTMRTANTTIVSERDQLKTLNTGLTTERDTLQTANTALTGEVAAVRKSFLDLAEKTGAVTPAERADFDTKLSTANSRETTLAEIVGAAGKPARKAMNTQAVELNGARHDISTANARQGVIETEVRKRIKANGTDWDTEFAAVKADKNFAGVFAAMQDPTKAAA